MTQALFLQRASIPMIFVVPVYPEPGATASSVLDDVQAHMIAAYTATGSLDLQVNGESAPAAATTAPGGIYLSMVSGALALTDQGDGFAHLHVEGVEDVAGLQEADWLVVPKARPPLSETAGGVLPIPAPYPKLAGGVATISQAVLQLAQGQIPTLALGTFLGRAGGRLFVGEFYLWSNGSGVANVAEPHVNADTSGAAEIYGYAVYDPTSGTLELLGTRMTSEVSGIANVVGVTLMTEGGGSVEVGTLVLNRETAGSAELWGTAGQTMSAGRLVIRVSSVHPKMVEALAAGGVRFGFESPLVVGTGAATVDES